MSCSQSDIAMLESRYFTDDSPHGLFRQCKYVAVPVGDIAVHFASFSPDSTLIDIQLLTMHRQ